MEPANVIGLPPAYFTVSVEAPVELETVPDPVRLATVWLKPAIPKVRYEL